MPLKREPNALLAATRMDRARRHLIVEGVRDQNVLSWLAGKNIDPNTTIMTIDAIDMPDLEYGGNRGRLFAFARMIENETNSIWFFADKDYDCYFGIEHPSNLTLTDFRDLEGYILKSRNFAKLIGLALNKNQVDSRSIFDKVNEICLQISALRIYDKKNELNLPFQDTPFARYISMKRDNEFKIEGYIQALLQNAGQSINLRDCILEAVWKILESFSEHDKSQLVHGKDAMRTLERLTKCYRIRVEEGERILWASLERESCTGYQNLNTVLRFLAGE